MKIGIIAEGWGDCGVIRQIIIGLRLVESLDDIKFIRPKPDATDSDPAAMSSWQEVKRECMQKGELDKFISITEGSPRLVIVQIDAAECEEVGYDVARPGKTSDLKRYSAELRSLVVRKIQNWLGGGFNERVAYAIAIQETEAWVLALLDNHIVRDSSSFTDPKQTLQQRIARLIKNKELKLYRTSRSELTRSEFVAAGFVNSRRRNEARERNKSLDLFLSELEGFHSLQ